MGSWLSAFFGFPELSFTGQVRLCSPSLTKMLARSEREKGAEAPFVIRAAANP